METIESFVYNILYIYFFRLAGPVVLEIPATPVIEGDDVMLYCRNKVTRHAQRAADFYRDGLFIKTGYKGNLPIFNVSKSHEGLYKCIISEAESPESWLSVRGKRGLFLITNNVTSSISLSFRSYCTKERESKMSVVPR